MGTVIDDTTLKSNISENLNRILTSLGMSRYRLAQATKESEQTIRNVADGLHIPRSGILARIAEATGVSVDELIYSPAELRQKRRSKKSLIKMEKVA